MLNDDEVRKIAKLANLTLTEDEVKQYGQQLSSILEYVQALEKIDVKGVEPMSHVHGITNVMREDVVEPSLDTMQAMQGAPDHSGRFFRVPLIVE
jgi:aspartyl-tRNA(Asn)/glutamyl-tRNA(Gln) amidotransferase subunit C